MYIRDKVNSDTLEVNHTPRTHFVFDPYKIWNANENSQIPKDAWERHAEYILSIIQESTQLQVGWKGPGEAITLHLPNHNKPPRKNKKGEQNYSQNVPSQFEICYCSPSSFTLCAEKNSGTESEEKANI
ncbi:hypothetical protein RIR_jg33431.t1 [Rhizophagus irregularis DAOM 181602=DAOM 197198]|nr:hypothetical protein RIR_jg33431.t1 [Rhizophagus irregularis DAOM 181602=DAOM 197198]